MSRTVKKRRWWCYGWFWRWQERPWKLQKDAGRRYKEQRKIQQRKFRQANRLALYHERECPNLPPFDWWEVD